MHAVFTPLDHSNYPIESISGVSVERLIQSALAIRTKVTHGGSPSATEMNASPAVGEGGDISSSSPTSLQRPAQQESTPLRESLARSKSIDQSDRNSAANTAIATAAQPFTSGSLRDLFYPQPPRASSSSIKPSDTSYGQSIHALTQHVAAQVRSPLFLDATPTVYDGRMLLFSYVLQHMREGLVRGEGEGGLDADMAALHDGDESAQHCIRMLKSNAAELDAAHVDEEHGAGEEGTKESPKGKRKSKSRPVPRGSAGGNNNNSNSTKEVPLKPSSAIELSTSSAPSAVGSEATWFHTVHKPNRLLLYVFDTTLDAVWLERAVDETLDALAFTGNEAAAHWNLNTCGGNSDAHKLIVHAAATVALLAAREARAAEVFLALLERVLQRVRVSGSAATASSSHLVQHVLLPLLYLIPLVAWPRTLMARMAQLLRTAHTPRGASMLETSSLTTCTVNSLTKFCITTEGSPYTEGVPTRAAHTLLQPSASSTSSAAAASSHEHEAASTPPTTFGHSSGAGSSQLHAFPDLDLNDEEDSENMGDEHDAIGGAGIFDFEDEGEDDDEVAGEREDAVALGQVDLPIGEPPALHNHSSSNEHNTSSSSFSSPPSSASYAEALEAPLAAAEMLMEGAPETSPQATAPSTSEGRTGETNNYNTNTNNNGVARRLFDQQTIFSLPHAHRVTVRIHCAQSCKAVRLLFVPIRDQHSATAPSADVAATVAAAAAAAAASTSSASTTTMLPSEDDDLVALCATPKTQQSYHYDGPCQILFVFPKETTSADAPAVVLQGEINVEVVSCVDSRQETEWLQALSKARLHVATCLQTEIHALHTLQTNSVGGGAVRANQFPFALLKGGLRDTQKEQSTVSTAAAAAAAAPSSPSWGAAETTMMQSLKTLTNSELRQRVHCRESEVTPVRAFLQVVDHFLSWRSYSNTNREAMQWQSKTWLEVVKRVSLSSQLLGKCAQPAELAAYLIEHVEGHLVDTPAEMVGHALQLFTFPQVSVALVEAFLTQASTQASLAEALLELLVECTELRSPKHLAAVAAVARDFLVPAHMTASGSSSHAVAGGNTYPPSASFYLSRIKGSGVDCEAAIRKQVHTLLGRFFQLLRSLYLKAAKLCSSPRSFLTESWEYAPFATLAVSLLAAPLDTEDVARLHDADAVRTAASLLPSFSEISRTDSILLHNEEEGRSLVGVLSQLFRRQEEREGNHQHLPQSQQQPHQPPPQQHQPTSSSQQQSRSTWKMVGAQMTSSKPNTFTSKHGVAFVHSDEPVFSFGYEQLTPSSIEVQVINDSLSDFYIGLCSSKLDFRTPDMSADPKGIFWMADGTLRRGLETFRLPAWSAGDVISFSFNFVRTRWRIGLCINFREYASFAASKDNLYLVLGYTNNKYQSTSFRGAIDQPLFRTSSNSAATPGGAAATSALRGRSVVSPGTSAGNAHSPVRPGTNGGGLSPFPSTVVGENEGQRIFVSQPLQNRATFYNLYLFTALVFRYIILTASKKMAQRQRTLAAAVANRSPSDSTTSVSPMATSTGGGGGNSAASNTSLYSRGEDLIIRDFTEECIHPLQQSIVQLLSSLDHLTDAAAFAESETEGKEFNKRVKREMAILVNNSLLFDNTVSLAAAFRSTVAPVGIMTIFTQLIRSSHVDDKTRAIALSSLHNTIQTHANHSQREDMKAFDPLPLWTCCRQLAVDVTEKGFRPTFSDATVPAELSVVGGGRKVMYKPGEAHASSRRAAAYAQEGIPLDGSAGDMVSFSVRIQRGFHTDTLGRFYYVGVASIASMDGPLLTAHPGARVKQHFTYDITDFFTDISDSRASSTLRKHDDNWLSSEDAVIYGSGDVITVTVDVRCRSVSFFRNGKPLGQVYRTVAPSVKYLFPFVELYNHDSMAKWMYPLRELSVLSRYTMRAMLQCWPEVLWPVLQETLEEVAHGDATGLLVLGADGDDMSVIYRSPPRAEVTPHSQNVRVIRSEENGFALIEDLSGTPLRVFGAALEADYHSIVPPPVNPTLLMPLLLQLIRDLLTISENNAMRIERPKVLLRALRLVSQWGECVLPTVTAEAETNAAGNRQQQQAQPEQATMPLLPLLTDITQRLLKLVQVPCMDLQATTLLREAWNEISWSKVEEPLSLLVQTEEEEDEENEEKEEEGEVDDNVADHTRKGSERSEVALCQLLCPTCGRQWNQCREQHPAPINQCTLYHLLLQQKGVASPFTGWCTTWAPVVRDEKEESTSALTAPLPSETHTAAGADDPDMETGAVESLHHSEGDEEADAETTTATAAAAPPPAAPTNASSSDSSEDLQVPVITRRSTSSSTAAAAAAAAAGTSTSTPASPKATTKEDEPEDIDVTNPPASVHPTVTFRCVDGDASKLEGKGECTYGRFTITGNLSTGTRFRGRITFDNQGEEQDEATAETTWSCEACTFINEASVTRCAICATPRPGHTWTCNVCTYAYNSNSSNVCATCGQVRRNASRTAATMETSRFCFCQKCQAKLNYGKFPHLRLRRHCAQCEEVTEWLPKEKYSGVVWPRWCGSGDHLELRWKIEGNQFWDLGFVTEDYSEASLLDLVVEAGLNPEDYVPPLVEQLTSEEEGSLTLKHSARALQSCITSALIYYASRLILLWGIPVQPQVFTNRRVLKRVRVFEESWLAHLKHIPPAFARKLLASCLHVLLFETNTSSSVRTTAAIARALLQGNPAVQEQRDYLLYALCKNALQSTVQLKREECYRCMTNILEDYPSDAINAQSLQVAVRMQPIVPYQQRAIVFGLLHKVSPGNTSPTAKATCALAHAMEAMAAKTPLPCLLQRSIAAALPYVVTLAETQLNEGGELLVGQVRGSVGIVPNRGGRYYFEVVLPPNFCDGQSANIVMGWGTLLHEQQSSSQHVGSDYHSWGFNCRDRLRLMMTEQMVSTPCRPEPGDVIGSSIDLASMTVSWSINGQEITRVSVPAQGESEEIYPYVSAAVEPWGVELRLAHTQYTPPDYHDYSTVEERDLWETEESPFPPQSYAFYKALCAFLEEGELTDVTSMTTIASAVRSAEGTRLLQRLPELAEVIMPDASGTVAVEALAHYMAHLQAVSELTVMVARNFAMVKDSPYLTDVYRRAKGLLFSTARWILFETQIGGKPTFNALHPRTVQLDVEKAKQAYVDPAGATLFTDSVTAQLFSQIETAPIYRNAVIFTVQLVGAVTTDAGGVTRSVLSMISDEINYQVEDGQRLEPLLPLCQLCAHSTIFTIVPNMRCLVGTDANEDDEENDNLYQRMFTWLGMLMGNIVLCGTMKLNLLFPRLVWKYLTYDEVTLEDYAADIDDTAIHSLQDDDFLLDNDCFYSLPGIQAAEETLGGGGGAAGAHRTSLPGDTSLSSSLPLSAAPPPSLAQSQQMSAKLRTFSITPAISVQEIVGGDDALDEESTGVCLAQEAARRRVLAEYALLHQYDPALAAMRQGLSTIIAPSSLKTIRWTDLQLRVCGSSRVTGEQVMAFMDCTNLPADMAALFAQAVQGMTETQLSQFLLFCSGQTRLPLPEKVHVTCGDDPSLIPTAHTCSPISLRLQPCANLEALTRKLDICLSHAKQFGLV